MATFYPQPLSKESWSQQWQRYMENKPLINNIEDIVQTQTKEYKNIIEHSSRQQIQAIQESTEAVCGTLDSGFELLSDNFQDISYGLGEIRSELNSMSSMLDWRLSLLIEQQRITNLLIGNVAILLRIPDYQKERYDYIEKGIKSLKNAYFDNDLYENALNYLQEAEKKENEDYFVLHRIGLIYMYSPKHIDLSKAEEYFKKAAKYAIVETNPGASISVNYLAGDVNTNLLTQIPTVDSIKLQAAESYMFAGRSCYIQGKLGEAAELAGKAFKIVPLMVEAGFTQAKALSADNKITQAAVVLKSVIKKDRFYSIKTIADLDLSPKIEIKNLLENFRQEAFNDASNLLSECKKDIISESMAQVEINKIEKLINKKSFLHCKKAIDLINNKKLRTFSDIFNTSKNKNVNLDSNLNELKNSLIEINKKVKYPETYVRMIKDLFDFLSKNTQWDFPSVTVLSDILNFKNGYESKNINSSLISFIKQEKEYFVNLPYVKTKIEKAIQEIYSDDIKRKNDDNVKLENDERARRNANNENMAASVGTGLLGGLIGGIVGLVIGFCLGLIVEIGSCVSNRTENGSNKYSGIIVISAIVICGIMGFLGGWESKRKKF